MNKAFLTNRDRPQINRQRAPWEYREQVEAALREQGVPLRVATLAVLDYQHLVLEGMQHKLPPQETALRMIDTVHKIFRRKDGYWLCAN